jgi:hypothetical protein
MSGVEFYNNIPLLQASLPTLMAVAANDHVEALAAQIRDASPDELIEASIYTVLDHTSGYEDAIQRMRAIDSDADIADEADFDTGYGVASASARAILVEYGGVDIERQSFWSETIQRFNVPDVDFQQMIEEAS